MLMRIERPQHAAPLLPAIDRRSVTWPMSVLYATLLLASIWKLDSDDVPCDATPPPTVAAKLARVQALMLGFAETLRRVPRDSVPLSREQTTPEGWPLWIDAERGGAPAATAPHAPD